VTVALPDEHWDEPGVVAVSTCPDHPAGSAVQPGDVLKLDGRTVVVLKEL
jgi:hypothetical protein